MLRFVMRVRHDDARVVRARRIQFHTIELDHLGYGAPGQHEFGPRAFEIDLAVVGAAVIGRHHPSEAVRLAHECIHGDRINRITTDDRGRRTRVVVPPDAIPAVDVMIAGQPAELARAGGRAGDGRGSGGRCAGGEGREQGDGCRHNADRASWHDAPILQHQCGGRSPPLVQATCRSR